MYAPLVQLKLWLVIHLLCIAHFPATQLSSYDGRNQARNLYQVKLIDIYVLCTHYRLCIQINWLNAFACIYITTGTKYELSSIQSGGALKIHQIDSGQDSGVYTCRVGRAGEEARRDIELTVNSKLRPFFPISLSICVVSFVKIVWHHEMASSTIQFQVRRLSNRLHFRKTYKTVAEHKLPVLYRPVICPSLSVGKKMAIKFPPAYK